MTITRLRTDAITDDTRDPGIVDAGEYSISADAVSVTIRVSNNGGWPEKSGRTMQEREVCEIKCELSMDNGSTWPLVYGARSPGRPMNDPDTGLPLIEVSMSPSFPKANTKYWDGIRQRKVRVSVECFARIKFGCHIDIET